ncbi:hypothetical protein ACIBF6_10080 [Streptosporangium amethystogenes]
MATGSQATTRPGSPNMPLVLDILIVLNEALTPCPDGRRRGRPPAMR